MQSHFEELVAPIATVLASLGVPTFVAWLLKRSTMRDDLREKLIEVLRKALDKGRVRENAYCGALDALVIGIDHLADPPAPLLAARARALKILETANRQISGGEL